MKRTLMMMPVWLKVTGNRIMELPIIELAKAMPELNGDAFDIIHYIKSIY